MPGNIDGRDLARREADLAAYQGTDRVITSQEFWEEAKNAPPPIEKTFYSGIPSLDKYTEGFETGEVWVVSGPTKHGKTTMCDTMGRHMTSFGAQCLWFSFEMTPRKFLLKYKEAGAPVIHIPRERITNNLEWIAQRVHEAKLKYDCRVVFIDHLHFIADLNQLIKNSSIYIGGIMRFLKQEIALRHNVCVFLIAHVTKIKFEEEPESSDIRDSSFITQEADGTLMVYRRAEQKEKKSDPDVYTNKARVKVCNARRSGVLEERVNLLKINDDLVEEAI